MIMSLLDLTEADFSYFKRRAKAMIGDHEKNFLRKIEPELMKCFYRGLNRKEDENNDGADAGFYKKRENFLTLSRIFTATNTLGPQLYYQNPQPIVIPQETGTKEGAALLSSALRKNMIDNCAEDQNPEACLSAWFFGIGWKKIGMRNSFISRNLDSPESQAQGSPPTNQADEMEPVRQDYFLSSQQFFNDTESPMNVMLDDKTDLRSGKLRLHRIKRTLYDLNNSGAYDEAMLKEVYDKLKSDRGSRLDSREIDLDLNELQIKFPTGIWILSWVDQYNKALRYDQSSYDEDFQLLPLIFTNEPFCRYPIAHMKVASQVQQHLDNMATLFIKTIDRVRNQVIVNQNDLAPGMKNALEQNKTGGIIYTNKPINPGTYQAIQSAAVQNDLPLLMNLVQQNLTELMGTDEQLIGGKSANDTLGQDELARVGTKVRESGMNDKVRKWMIKQFKQEAKLMQQNSQSEMSLKVTPQDYSSLPPGAQMQDTFQSFGTQQNPVPFKAVVPGKYDYDMNVYDAPKPDKKVIQGEYLQALNLFSNPNIQNALAMSGVKPNLGVLGEGIAETFEWLRAKDFIEHLDPQQQAAYQTSLMLMAGGMPPHQAPVPPAGSKGSGQEPPPGAGGKGQPQKSSQGVSNPSQMAEAGV